MIVGKMRIRQASDPNPAYATLVATLGLLAAAASVLRLEGRRWWCACGDLNVWTIEAWGAHTSQHLFDPYSLTHVLHGLVLWGLLGLADRRLRRWGESFLLFGLGYCAIRFTCEWFRADSATWAWGWTPAQFICLGAAGMLAMTWGVRSRLARRGHSELSRRLAGA